MKKILISLLGKEAHVLRAGAAIKAIKNTYRSAHIEVLTYERFRPMVELFSQLDCIHTIDDKKVRGLIKNSLYSDAFALNSFYDSIYECQHTKWDLFINYSNDLTSSYLASYFNVDQVVGTRIGKMGNPRTNNNWASFRNFYLPKNSFKGISFHQAALEMLHLDWSARPKFVRIDQGLDAEAKRHIDKIKYKDSLYPKKLIGLNLEHSYSGRSLDLNFLLRFIEEVNYNDELTVIILTKKTPKEIGMINEINNRFKNQITSVSSSLEALPSILKNLDMFIGLENATLDLADSLGTASVEIKANIDAASEMITPGSYMVYSEDFKSLENDLFFIINQFTGSSLSVDRIDSKNRTYALVDDDYGPVQTQINGPIDLQRELNYLLSRYYNFRLLGKPASLDFEQHLNSAVSSMEIKKFKDQCEEQLNLALRVCLSALRNVPGSLTCPKQAQRLLDSLDLINDMTHENHLTQGAFALFEGRIENLPSGMEAENVKQIEAELYQLKNDLDLAFTTLALFGNSREKSFRPNEARAV